MCGSRRDCASSQAKEWGMSGGFRVAETRVEVFGAGSCESWTRIVIIEMFFAEAGKSFSATSEEQVNVLSPRLPAIPPFFFSSKASSYTHPPGFNIYSIY